MSWAECVATGRMTPLPSSSRSAARARDPVMRSRSDSVDTVMSLALTTSACTFSHVPLSIRTAFAAFSTALALDHFFFLPLEALAAARALAALDAWTLGACRSEGGRRGVERVDRGRARGRRGGAAADRSPGRAPGE